MFSVEDRERARERVLALARADPRITGGALTGSASVGREDRWSDIDLSFGVADDADPEAVLTEWTEVLTRELGVAHHWDLRAGPTTYRVLLLPGALELDVAVTPAAEFGAHGLKFQLLFGDSVEHAPSPPPRAEELAGFAWLYALNARTALGRGRPWEAEHWVSGVRDHALELACVRLGQPAGHGRGVDGLPPEVVAPYEEALVRSLADGELRRALAVTVELFLREVRESDPELASRLHTPLRVDLF